MLHVPFFLPRLGLCPSIQHSRAQTPPTAWFQEGLLIQLKEPSREAARAETTPFWQDPDLRVTSLKCFFFFKKKKEPSSHPWAFPGGSGVKNLPASAGDEGDASSIPGWGRSPGEGHGDPLPYSCLGNPMDRRAWWATDHGVTELDTMGGYRTSQMPTSPLGHRTPISLPTRKMGSLPSK